MNRIMQWIPKLAGLALFLGVALTTPNAWADGGIVSAQAYEVAPREPLQEAVILHDGLHEQMLLHVLIEAEGSDLAWLVPVPSRPQVALANPAIFSRLEFASGPKVQTRRHGLYFGLLAPAAVLLIFLLRVWGKRKLVTIVVGLMLALLALTIFPGFIVFSWLGSSEFLFPAATLKRPRVTQLDAYEITTFSPSQEKELMTWLRQHNYRLPRDGQKVLRQYLDQGWHFVGLRLAAASSEAKPGRSLVQPPTLSLGFDSKEIIFPLKISSIMGDQSTVMLDVLAPGYVEAEGFQTIYAGGAPDSNLSQYLPEEETVVSLSQASSLTRLRATFQAGEMEDVKLKINPRLAPRRLTAYTQELKHDSGVILATCLLMAFGLVMRKGPRRLKTVCAGLILVSIGLCSSPRSLLNSAPWLYRESLGGERPYSDLETLVEAQRRFYNQHHRYGQAFASLDWMPSAASPYTFYLSRDEYSSPTGRDPYAFLFEEVGELKALGDFAPSPEGFVAVAIGPGRRGQAPQIWMIREGGSAELLSYNFSNI